MKFKTLDDVELKSKTVFCRIDMNCPIDEKTKLPVLSERIIAHAQTIFELANKGAKTVVLAHQGRKGDEDFTSLKEHSKMLKKQVNKLARKAGSLKPKLKFVSDVCGKKAQKAIKHLLEGQILVLDNVRLLDDETNFGKTGKSQLVDSLLPLCDIFVLDAFSVSHRAHASVVGFSSKPCIAGRVMEKELKALSSFENPKKPVVFILGGAKPDDSLPILSAWLEGNKLEYALCGGTLANLMLMASGESIGKSKEFLDKSKATEKLEVAKQLYVKFEKQIILPTDLVLDENGKANIISTSSLPSQFEIHDIGPATIKKYKKIIKSAGSIVLNGPMGVYEKEEFSIGTKSILKAISKSSAFSLLGGGHTIEALKKFRIKHEKFGYVSLSGKALIEFLCGDKLPGVEMLEKST